MKEAFQSLCIFQEEEILGPLSWFFTTQKQQDVPLTRDHGSAWQVLKVSLLFPVLGRSFARDLSPLKPLLVQGKWDWVRRRSVPLEAGGTFR